MKGKEKNSILCKGGNEKYNQLTSKMKEEEQK